MAGILLGAMPWATCWSRYHRRCKKKIQTNPHNTSEYPRSEWQADQTTGKSGFLVSMQTGFSPDHHLQSIALHSWWWSPRSPLRNEMRRWKQSWGDGLFPSLGLPTQDTSILSLLSGLSRTHHRAQCCMIHRKTKVHSGPASRPTHDPAVSPTPSSPRQPPKSIRTYQTQSSQTSEFRA